MKKNFLLCIADIIAPIKGARWQWAVSSILGLLLSVPAGVSAETVSIVRESADVFNDLFIAFVAMEMGAYALFQALLSDQLIWVLYKNKNLSDKSNTSLLDKSNTSFLGVILLFWVGIMINLVLMLLLKIIPTGFLLFSDINKCNSIAVLLLFLYYTVSFRILFEVRNFAINLYKVFVLYNKTVILEMMREEKENEK